MKMVWCPVRLGLLVMPLSERLQIGSNPVVADMNYLCNLHHVSGHRDTHCVANAHLPVIAHDRRKVARVVTCSQSMENATCGA